MNPRHRGQGLGRRLTEAALASIPVGTDVKLLEVGVNPIQVAAYKLYKDLGFEEVRSEPYILGDGKEYQVIFLQKVRA